MAEAHSGTMHSGGSSTRLHGGATVISSPKMEFVLTIHTCVLST